LGHLVLSLHQLAIKPTSWFSEWVVIDFETSRD